MHSGTYMYLVKRLKQEDAKFEARLGNLVMQTLSERKKEKK